MRCGSITRGALRAWYAHDIKDDAHWQGEKEEDDDSKPCLRKGVARILKVEPLLPQAGEPQEEEQHLAMYVHVYMCISGARQTGHAAVGSLTQSIRKGRTNTRKMNTPPQTRIRIEICACGWYSCTLIE